MNYVVCPQGAASSAAPAKASGQPDAMLLAYGEELPQEDCTEGADESDDGGARRLLRSHVAAAAAAGPNCGFKRAAYQVRIAGWLPIDDWDVVLLILDDAGQLWYGGCTLGVTRM